MSMTNFIPWRKQRRLRCLRFWGVLSGAALLLLLTVLGLLRMDNALELRARQTQQAGAQTVQKVLVARQKQGAQAPIPTHTASLQAWQPVLESLSATIPAQAWLTELRYQPPSLMVIGYATALSALSTFRDALRGVTGFTPGLTGELQQLSPGRWAFTFQLLQQE
ncbi:PilN domain-containing protein [unidentified bacterial endosymbiont]|jgi:pilus assembly protein HofN|uniref:PilN domain-containing protein n=1 Tax=unidentified bacterial endosymbiont TaxID=2355 RepID=UPI00209FC3B9|nr:PilN domain-containing protein [unidentified bacterial endosymbiont]